MKIINVETINGMSEEIIYNPEEIDFTGIMLSAKESTKRSKNGGVRYLEIPCAFDIETTNVTEDFNNRRFNFTDENIYQYLHGIRLYYDDAVKKTVYLSLMEIEKKWTQPIHNWGLIMNQFILIFENRIQI